MSDDCSPVSPLRVLVVDDDRSVVDALACLVEELGHLPVVAHDGPEGVEVAERIQPDVVVVDLSMPSMDGVAVAKSLGSLRDQRGLRVVLVTGWGAGEAEAAMAHGCFDACLLKPFGVEQLAAALAPPPTKLPLKSRARREAPCPSGSGGVELQRREARVDAALRHE